MLADRQIEELLGHRSAQKPVVLKQKTKGSNQKLIQKMKTLGETRRLKAMIDFNSRSL